MKAVVLEVRDGLAAVLREDGTVEKIRRDCRVGETIEVDAPGRVIPFPGKATKWVAAAAAALVILSAGGTYGYNNAYAYSYVTLEDNPSVEYVLNRKNRVLRVEALTEEGEALAAELTEAGVKNATLSDAMELTEQIVYGGSAPEEAPSVNIASRGQKQQESLQTEMEEYLRGREQRRQETAAPGERAPEAPAQEAPQGAPQQTPQETGGQPGPMEGAGPVDSNGMPESGPGETMPAGGFEAAPEPGMENGGPEWAPDMDGEASGEPSRG